MCAWFYANRDYKPLADIIDKAGQLPLADRIMIAMEKAMDYPEP